MISVLLLLSLIPLALALTLTLTLILIFSYPYYYFLAATLTLTLIADLFNYNSECSYSYSCTTVHTLSTWLRESGPRLHRGDLPPKSVVKSKRRRGKQIEASDESTSQKLRD